MTALQVLLGDVSVGLVEKLGDYEYRFSFEDSYLSLANRPVLGQVFEDYLPRPIVTTGHPALWFCHLLPAPGRPLRLTIARTAGLDPDDDFGLLDRLGADLPGAVIMRPGIPRLKGPTPVTTPPQTVERLRLSSSLAGAQWKVSVGESGGRLTLGIAGGGRSWIAKLYDPSFPELPRIELATTQWAKAAGLDVPEFRAGTTKEIENLPVEVPVGDGQMFLIQRFDRELGGPRLHMEDFAQILDQPNQYSKAYEHVAAVIGTLCPQDTRAFCERLVFAVVCGNTDAHLKNWSLIYRDGTTPRLAPCYDLVASFLYAPPLEDLLALPLDRSTRFEEVTAQSFRRLARVVRRPFDEVAGWVAQAAARHRQVWADEKTNFAFVKEERARIDQHLARLKL